MMDLSGGHTADADDRQSAQELVPRKRFGDFRALVKRGRRVIGVDLGEDTFAGIKAIVGAALSGRPSRE